MKLRRAYQGVLSKTLTRIDTSPCPKTIRDPAMVFGNVHKIIQCPEFIV
jgi:hypothetical protein